MRGADVHVAKHPVVAGWRHGHPWIWIKHGINKALVCSMGAAVNNSQLRDSHVLEVWVCPW